MRNETILTLIILICFITSAHAAQVWVEPPHLEVSEGANFTIDIMVDPEGDDEVMGAEYKLYFNNTLLYATDQVQGPFLGGNLIGIPDPINNTIGRVWYGEYRIGGVGVTAPGVLASITFQVIGERGVSELDLTDVMLSNTSAAEIPANVTDGSVEIVSGICGDVNDDGNVNMADVMTLWYDLADYPATDVWTISNVWAADVNCDGDLNMADVMTLWYDIADYPASGDWVIGCC
jgi:hypothetical protein